MKKVLVVHLLLFFGVVVWAFPPVVVIGVDGVAVVNPGNSLGRYIVGASFSADYRTVLGDIGYFGSWLDVRFAGEVTTLSAVSDTEEFGFVVGTSGRPFELEAGSHLVASTGLLGGPQQGTVEWHTLVELPFADHRASAGASYLGSYTFEPDSDTDRMSHGGLLFLEHNPALALGYLFELDGSVESYSEQPVLDGAGAPTSVHRTDYIAGAASQLEGLIDYFTSWNLRVEGGARLSNGNRFLDFTSAVENDSESRIYGRLTAGAQTSPSREWGIAGALMVDGAAYLQREALDAGVPIGDTAHFVTTSLGGSIEWSPNGHLYVVLEGFSSMTFSNDTQFEQWSVQLGAGINWRF